MGKWLSGVLMVCFLASAIGASQPLDICCSIENLTWLPLVNAKTLLQLENARRTIYVVMPSVDETLAEALVRAFSRRIVVRVVVDRDHYDSHVMRRLRDLGIDVRFAENIAACFIVVDEKLVITGSYCWARHPSALVSALFIESEEFARRFVADFDSLFSLFGVDFTLPAMLEVAVPITRTAKVEVSLVSTWGKSLPVGDVSFSIKERLPSGIRVFFSPNPVKVTQRSRSVTTTLTVEAESRARTGIYTLTVVATGGGMSKESTLTIIVQVAPDYSLEVFPAEVTVKQGASTTVTVNIRRNETMREPVDLVVEGVPAGVKVIADPARVPADRTSATLRIETGSTVDAKDYTLTIRGKAAGIADKTVTLRLSVRPVNSSLKAEPSVMAFERYGMPGGMVSAHLSDFIDFAEYAAIDLSAKSATAFDLFWPIAMK